MTDEEAIKYTIRESLLSGKCKTLEQRCIAVYNALFLSTCDIKEAVSRLCVKNNAVEPKSLVS